MYVKIYIPRHRGIFRIVHESKSEVCLEAEKCLSESVIYSALLSISERRCASVFSVVQQGAQCVTLCPPVEESVLHAARALALHSEDSCTDGYSEAQIELAE